MDDNTESMFCLTIDEFESSDQYVKPFFTLKSIAENRIFINFG